MDIATVISTFTTYGGPWGFVGAIAGLFLLDRKHSTERRDELRKDLEREQTDNERLRLNNISLQETNDSLRAEKNSEYLKRIELEEVLRVHRDGGATP